MAFKTISVCAFVMLAMLASTSAASTLYKNRRMLGIDETSVTTTTSEATPAVSVPAPAAAPAEAEVTEIDPLGKRCKQVSEFCQTNNLADGDYAHPLEPFMYITCSNLATTSRTCAACDVNNWKCGGQTYLYFNPNKGRCAYPKSMYFKKNPFKGQRGWCKAL